MTVDDLRYWLPEGVRQTGYFTFRICDVCLEVVPEGVPGLHRLRQPTSNKALLYLCADCWAEWREKNQDVLVMAELMQE